MRRWKDEHEEEREEGKKTPRKATDKTGVHAFDTHITRTLRSLSARPTPNEHAPLTMCIKSESN